MAGIIYFINKLFYLKMDLRNLENEILRIYKDENFEENVYFEDRYELAEKFIYLLPESENCIKYSNFIADIFDLSMAGVEDDFYQWNLITSMFVKLKYYERYDLIEKIIDNIPEEESEDILGELSLHEFYFDLWATLLKNDVNGFISLLNANVDEWIKEELNDYFEIDEISTDKIFVMDHLLAISGMIQHYWNKNIRINMNDLNFKLMPEIIPPRNLPIEIIKDYPYPFIFPYNPLSELVMNFYLKELTVEQMIRYANLHNQKDLEIVLEFLEKTEKDVYSVEIDEYDGRKLRPFFEKYPTKKDKNLALASGKLESVKRIIEFSK